MNVVEIEQVVAMTAKDFVGATMKDPTVEENGACKFHPELQRSECPCRPKAPKFVPTTLIVEVMNELSLLDRAIEDVRLFHADDCGPLVTTASRNRLRALLDRAGLTAEEFLDGVEARTTPRWVYFSGLSQIVSILEPQPRTRW